MGDSDNGPIIESILALRHEQAQLVGFPNFVEYSMASKVPCDSPAVMFPAFDFKTLKPKLRAERTLTVLWWLKTSQMATLKTALALLEQLRQASYDTAALELKHLRAFAASQVHPGPGYGHGFAHGYCCAIATVLTGIFGGAELLRHPHELGRHVLGSETAASTIQPD